MGFPGSSDGKEPACNAGDLDSVPWVEKIPWRREWLPTPLFLPEEFHGQRSLAGYSPWGPKELDTTEVSWHACMHCYDVDHIQCVLRNGEGQGGTN